MVKVKLFSKNLTFYVDKTKNM